MPQIEWPIRRIQAATLSGAAARKFTVHSSNQNFLEDGDEIVYKYVTNNLTFSHTRWITHDSNDPSNTFGASNTQNPPSQTLVDPEFTIEIPAVVLVNFPSRPILKDPGMVMNSSISNPARATSYSVGYPRYEGSVELDVPHNEDVKLVEAFIDQLHDPNNWFEMPLSTDIHLGATNVDTYNTDGTIDVIRTTEDSIHGYWGRVGWRTCRVTSDTNIIPNINEGNQQQEGYKHTIGITPVGMIATLKQSSDVFSSATTMRVRATNVNAIGDTDFEASWVINFEESDGGATS